LRHNQVAMPVRTIAEGTHDSKKPDLAVAGP
jgi:hypothetical protein